MWGNFVGSTNLGRSLVLKDPRIPDVFMIHPRFGITRAWYHPFSRRLLFHYASFQGEAHLHHSKLLSASRVAKGLRKAWFLIRILERMWERVHRHDGLAHQ